MVSLTVTRRPFCKCCQPLHLHAEMVLEQLTQSPVALAISSPTFLGERPRGPIFGARADEAPTSPPVALRWITLTSLGSNFGAEGNRWLAQDTAMAFIHVQSRSTSIVASHLSHLDIERRAGERERLESGPADERTILTHFRRCVR